MEVDYTDSGVKVAARKYLEDERDEFNRWISNVNSARRNKGEETYSASELWDYFESVDTLEEGPEQNILLSPDLSPESGAEYLDIDEDTAYMTILENSEDIENYSQHDDEEVTTMIDSFLHEWKDPREIAQSVDTGENGVTNVLNRAGIEALDNRGEITQQRVRLAEHKNMNEEEMENFVFPESEKSIPEKYKPGRMQEEKNYERTTDFEISIEMDDIERGEAAAWYMQNSESQDPAQLTTSLLKMGYEVDFGEENEIIEEALETEVTEEKAEHLEEEHGDNVI